MTIKKDQMSISNFGSRTADAPAKEHSTALRAGSIGVLGILFFVLSAQAPLTGIVGASPLAAALGNGAGAPGAPPGHPIERGTPVIQSQLRTADFYYRIKPFLDETLRLTGGNREHAAKLLGIGERTLYRKLKEYGLR